MSDYTRLLEILDLEKIDDNTYRAGNLDIGSPQIYGGQVLAQCVLAATKTVEADREMHSIHGYFLSPGNLEKDIVFQVEVIKDGRSFSTRRVKALQGDRVIFLMAASFHIQEEGLSHALPMNNVTQPESLSSFPEIFSSFAEKFNIKPRGIYSKDSSVIFLPVEHFNPFQPGKRAPYINVWFKINGEFPDDQSMRRAMILYASDFNLLITSLLPHNVSLIDTPFRIASLDHATWFHRPIVDDDWMLYSIESPSAYNSLGFCTGRIYSRQGELLASVTQEGLIRKL